MKKILYLTNLSNDAPEEDLYLAGILKNKVEIILAHPLQCEQYLSSVDGIISRNIWPVHEYMVQWKKLCITIQHMGIPTYNPFVGKGDFQGKQYLVDLYAQHFPVVPSVDQVTNIHLLPESKYFWIKPKNGEDGFGSEKLSRDELLKRSLDDYIAQPYLSFITEPCFFFIDNHFSYAISMPNRLTDRNFAMYQPSPEELYFCNQFVIWNNLPYGIQRIDVLKMPDGTLLLNEIEDIAEYLYLLKLEEKTRTRVVKEITSSIFKALDV